MTTKPVWRWAGAGIWAGYGPAVDSAPYLSASGTSPSLILDPRTEIYGRDPNAWQASYITGAGFVPWLVLDIEFGIYGATV